MARGRDGREDKGGRGTPSRCPDDRASAERAAIVAPSQSDIAVDRLSSSSGASPLPDRLAPPRAAAPTPTSFCAPATSVSSLGPLSTFILPLTPSPSCVPASANPSLGPLWTLTSSLIPSSSCAPATADSSLGPLSTSISLATGAAGPRGPRSRGGSSTASEAAESWTRAFWRGGGGSSQGSRSASFAGITSARSQSPDSSREQAMN